MPTGNSSLDLTKPLSNQKFDVPFCVAELVAIIGGWWLRKNLEIKILTMVGSPVIGARPSMDPARGKSRSLTKQDFHVTREIPMVCFIHQLCNSQALYI